MSSPVIIKSSVKAPLILPCEAFEVSHNKAKVSGNGVHEINVGDNNITIIVSNKNGKSRTYNVNIRRN